MNEAMVDVRLRTVISDAELEKKIGKVITDEDYNLLLTGPARLRTPDNRLLAIYLPGALTNETLDASYPTLHELRKFTTQNRGLAGGTERVQRGEQKRSYAKAVSSAIIGSIDPGGQQRYCRLTAWTGDETKQFMELYPLFQEIARLFEEHVPDRYVRQMEYVQKTDPSWIIPNTPFTTITVNNTYPTGVHTDKGDLDVGFSTLACLRKGKYRGGVLTFPRYRVGVNMQHGDVVLMNAHEYHGNTYIEPESEDAERVSVVCYFRTRMAECGSPQDELRKAQEWRDRSVPVAT